MRGHAFPQGFRDNIIGKCLPDTCQSRITILAIWRKKEIGMAVEC